MTLLDICKLKTATYLQERMITEPVSTVSITNEALEQWTEYIQLPVQYRHAFLESYSKSEQEFNSLTHPLAPDIVLEDQQKWIDDLQQLMSDFNANESILYAVKGHIPTEHPKWNPDCMQSYQGIPFQKRRQKPFYFCSGLY